MREISKIRWLKDNLISYSNGMVVWVQMEVMYNVSYRGRKFGSQKLSKLRFDFVFKNLTLSTKVIAFSITLL